MKMKSRWALTREGFSYSIRLNEGETTIGRNSTCTIIINSSFCSRHHCKIVVDDSKVTLEDYSSNGTGINDQQILNNSVSLKADDRIGIGIFDVTSEELTTESYHVYILKNIKSNQSTPIFTDPKSQLELMRNKTSKCKVKIKKENIYLQSGNIINPYNKIVTRSYKLKKRHTNI